MPRPASGYTNKAGTKVPGTNDITGRYGDKSALLHWAHKQGKAGLNLYDRSALDIGSAVHKMAELDLIGASDREIEATLFQYLSAPNHIAMANTSFKVFREWREQCRVRVIAQEGSLVSEAYQYGGTPDLIAIVNNGIGIIDFKTGKAVYPEMKIALSAHANLWNEANPKMAIDTHHLIILPKDGGPFQHHAYADLTREWEMFKLFREAWRLEKEWDVQPKASAKTAKQSAAKIKEAVVTDASPVVKEKPRIRIKMQTAPQPTMAEMLRAYGHVPGVAA